MRKLILIAFGGLVAQLIDGSLGMAYGVTSTTVLLAGGLTPAVASASVHLAEVGTNLASGISHWRLKNVDWWLVLRLGVPGAIGSFLGATVLSRLSTEAAAPAMAGILVVLGLFIMGRFTIRPPKVATVRKSPHGAKFLAPLGVIGGFVDATGGGGWGPVSTTALMSAGRTAPRTVIGSVDTSEFLVSVAASLGFLFGLGTAGINFAYALTLLAGGLVAAPIAAWLVTKIPAQLMGTLVGGIIVLTNIGNLLKAVGVSSSANPPVQLGVGVVWAVAVVVVLTRRRRSGGESEAVEVKETAGVGAD